MEEILHQLIGTLSLYIQGFIHPRWCRIPSITSLNPLNIFMRISPKEDTISVYFMCLINLPAKKGAKRLSAASAAQIEEAGSFDERLLFISWRTLTFLTSMFFKKWRQLILEYQQQTNLLRTSDNHKMHLWGSVWGDFPLQIRNWTL